MISAAGCTDGIVRVWDLSSGTLLRALAGHASSVFSVTQVAQSASTWMLCSGSADGTCRVWDVQRGDCLRVLTMPESPHQHATLVSCVLVTQWYRPIRATAHSGGTSR
jgi:WD40 repeat protein